MGQTTKSIIPEDWEQKSFSECVEKTSIPRQIKIPQGQYQRAGKYPIVDQGADFIAGYTNDKSKLYSGQLPVIVFGDHTRIFKYVDFAFSLGADGTKLLCPKKFLNPQYFYYYLSGLSLESKGYNRHYKYLKENLISFPEMLEQRKISHILLNIKNAIEQQEKIIAKTKELKRSLMHRLFTYGLHGEELKETEIGQIPKSWNVLKLGEVATLQRGNDLPRYEFKDGDIPVIGSNGCIGYHNQKIMDGPGVVTGRSGSIGKVSYVVGPYWPHNTALYVKDFHGNYPLFVFYMMHRLDFNKYKTGVSVPTLNRNFIHGEIVPVPDVQEQIDIAEILSRTDKKTEQVENQHKTLSALFKSLLQLLMTGQIRVKDIDFGEINV